MDLAIFNDGGAFLGRWLHIFSGIVWIGLLYYFNFVQTPFFGETDANTKSGAIQKLVPRALWWFRWGALFTFLFGFFLLYKNYMTSSSGMAIFYESSGVLIMIGAVLGTIMMLNVWGIIWRCQKVVIASTVAVAQGGKADPRAADAGARAGVASRINTLFSIPLLFFMAAANHLAFVKKENPNYTALVLILLVIIGAIEANAIFGKLVAPIKTVKAVVISGFVLTAILYAVVEMTF